MMNVVFASNNHGKIRELAALLTPYQIQLIPQSDLNIGEAEETGLTFIENALIKARHAAKLTHIATIADDSGLMVDALHGEPGIYSARYCNKT